MVWREVDDLKMYGYLVSIMLLFVAYASSIPHSLKFVNGVLCLVLRWLIFNGGLSTKIKKYIAYNFIVT